MLVLEINIPEAPIEQYKKGLNVALPTPEVRKMILEEVAKIIRKGIIKNYEEEGAYFGRPFVPNSQGLQEYKNSFFKSLREYNLPSELNNPLVQIYSGGTAYTLIEAKDTASGKAIDKITPDILEVGIELSYEPLNNELLVGLSDNEIKKIDELLQNYARSVGTKGSPLARGDL